VTEPTQPHRTGLLGEDCPAFKYLVLLYHFQSGNVNRTYPRFAFVLNLPIVSSQHSVDLVPNRIDMILEKSLWIGDTPHRTSRFCKDELGPDFRDTYVGDSVRIRTQVSHVLLQSSLLLLSSSSPPYRVKLLLLATAFTSLSLIWKIYSSPPYRVKLLLLATAFTSPIWKICWWRLTF
jgi:hypothetical protein